MSQIIPEIKRVESLRLQRTLAKRVDVKGFGFWSSQDVVYSFRPAPDNSGIRFFRSDLQNSEPIPALTANRIKKPRQTSLVQGNAQVDMVEHILAALRGARIDNCNVVVNAPEAPGMDGSGKTFIDAFLNVGSVEQSSEKIRLKILTPGKFTDDSKNDGSELLVLPNDEGKTIYEYVLRYDVPSPIPNQKASFDFSQSPEIFQREIAPCRTFLTLEEASYLRAQGLCARVDEKDALVYSTNGPMNNQTLFDNECARHKILDMIGDFSLSAVEWEGEFHAFKTGHQQNADALHALLKSVDPKVLR